MKIPGRSINFQFKIQIILKDEATIGSPADPRLDGDDLYREAQQKHPVEEEPQGGKEGHKESRKTLDYVERILKEERGIEFAAKPLETSCLKVENIDWTFVFYEDGLEVNVLYTIDNPRKRAVGFKLSEGMDVPKELEGKFKFAKMKSKLAGTIRGSFFVIKGEY